VVRLINNKLLLNFSAFLLLTFAAQVANAGGCFSTTKDGSNLANTCVRWDQNKDVVWNFDAGPVKGPAAEEGGGGVGSGGSSGCQLTKQLNVSNAEGVAMVERAFKRWMDVPGSKLNIVKGTALNNGADVDFTNIENFWSGGFVFPAPADSNVSAEGCYDNDANTACLNPIIFDHSGLITQAIQGQCAHCSILGFAGILPKVADDAPQNTILDKNLASSQAVVSGACLEPRVIDPVCGDCCPQGITVDNVEGTMTHELGHFLGLDHTLINKAQYLDCSDDSGCDAATKELIPTMIGFFVPGMDFNTLTEDDKRTFAGIYPAANLASTTCSVSGIARRNDGDSTLNKGTGAAQRGLEVVARLVGDDKRVAVGTVSGAYAKRVTQGVAGASGTDGKNILNCAEASSDNCAHYEIFGLEPGNYYLAVQDFQDQNGDGSSLGFVLEPLTPPLSDNAILDNPVDPTQSNSKTNQFTCVAGVPVTNFTAEAN